MGSVEPQRASPPQHARGGGAPGDGNGDGRGQPGTATFTSNDGPAPDNPRRRLVLALTEAIGAGIEAGDLHAARVAHEALGRLIAAPQPDAPVVAELNTARGGPGKMP